MSQYDTEVLSCLPHLPSMLQLYFVYSKCNPFQLCAFHMLFPLLGKSQSVFFSSNVDINYLRTISLNNVSQFLPWIWTRPYQVFITEYYNCLMIVFPPQVCKSSELKDCLFHSGIFRTEHNIGYKVDIKLTFTALSYFPVCETKPVRKCNMRPISKGITLSTVEVKVLIT